MNQSHRDLTPRIKKYIRRAISIVHLCLFSSFVFAQFNIKGRVITIDGVAVQGANLVLSNKLDSKILSYGITDGTGSYQISFNSTADSLLLSLSHLNYAHSPKTFHRGVKTLDWIVEETSFDLPILEVKPKTVIRRGDTLVFSTTGLREINDENLEDILSHIPGIKIEDSGQIKYKGLPISRFYIEGLDLLEGRYALATRGLKPDAILDIEVLENHQHIRALDGIIDPPNAAINVKLKSSIVFTGYGEAGLGLSPLLYKLSGVLFGFRKNQQINVIGGSNNVGQDQKSSFRDFYDQNVRSPLIHAQTIEKPLGLASMNVQDNREIISGLNILQKVNKKNQLKIQIAAGSNLLSRIGSRQSSLTDGRLSVNFEEELNAVQKPRFLQGRIIWEQNLTSVYVKGQLSVDVNQDDTSTDNTVNSIAISENLLQPTISLKGKADVIFRRKEKAFRVKTRHAYKKYNYDFSIYPIPLILTNLSDIDSIEHISQVSRLTESISEVYTGFYYKLGRFKPSAELGAAYQSSSFNNELGAYSNGENIISSLYDDFNGAATRTTTRLYFNHHYRAKLGKIDAELKAPFALHLLKTGSPNETRRDGLFVTNTRLSFSRKFLNGGSLILGSDYTSDYYQNQPFYPGDFLTNSRNISRSVLKPLQYRQHGIDLSYRRDNILKSISYNGYLGLIFNRMSQIFSNTFDSQGLTSTISLSDNIQRYLQLRHTISTNLWSWGFISVEVNYGNSRTPSLINDQLVNIKQHELKTTTNISWTFGKNVLSLKPYIKALTNSVSESNILQANLTANYFRILPGQLGKFNVSLEAYRTVIDGKKVNNNLLSAWYKVDLPKSKISVSLRLNNMLNATNFVTFQQFGFSERLSLFRLRQRQLLLVLKREF